ncbi:MAG: hypothetical protein K6F99_11540, partial [Lachnospiraceae bacterium]|nr:hypothetical protein [Lachnospiraceae bacterium]
MSNRSEKHKKIVRQRVRNLIIALIILAILVTLGIIFIPKLIRDYFPFEFFEGLTASANVAEETKEVETFEQEMAKQLDTEPEEEELDVEEILSQAEEVISEDIVPMEDPE